MRKSDLIRKNMVESVNTERLILSRTNNPFVVRLYFSFTSTQNLYIVMEYLHGGDIFSLLRIMGALEEEVARLYISETILALEYCHSKVCACIFLSPPPVSSQKEENFANKNVSNHVFVKRKGDKF
jgi:serine/threonine protein kinase